MNNNLPQHIVVIPDGNRRWARAKNLKPWDGHRKATKRFSELVEESIKLGIPYFSFWGLSVDNIKNRSKKEVDFLLNIFEKELRKLIKRKEIHEKRIRINALGFWKEMFPKKISKVIEEAIKITRNYDGVFVNLFLAYNGTNEILRAVKRIKKQIVKNPNLRITPDLIKKNLFTKDLPPVDYLIRTGGESHLSAGFMMWDIADVQFYFTKIYFPDFGKKEFRKAIREYQRRERRFGG
jgi:undecaprenyl diphosphate synthase